MDNSMKLYWELVYEKQSTSEILRQLCNPIREYETEMIDGAIIDIGCGQSPFLLDFASTNRELIAIDNEQIQLDFLKARVEKEKLATLDNWKFLNQSFPQDELPNTQYSLIVFSNLLHFFTLEENIEIGQIVSKATIKGSLVYVGVHSEKFYANNPKDPNNNDYFKHYFTIADLEKVFPNNEFERIYYAEIDKIDPLFERKITVEWLERSLKADGITDPKHIELIKRDYMKNKNQSDIITIFRRK